MTGQAGEEEEVAWITEYENNIYTKAGICRWNHVMMYCYHTVI